MRITNTATIEVEALEDALHQLQRLSEAICNEESLDAETAALENALVGKTEEMDMYSDLAQIGTAVGIVHHELANVTKGIRANFHKLKPWADANEKLKEIYADLRNSFHHLDEYLKLFTPLSRRLTRQRVPISGDYIYKYLLDIFDDRIRRHNIAVKVTENFRAKTVEGFPSTFLPCFVNILDNAIYWLGMKIDGQRLITLDADSEGFKISNSGQGIPLRVAENIFDFGTSLKPGGRGMGLYVSRETLRKEGFDIVLDKPGEMHNPTFVIITNRGGTLGDPEEG